MATTPDVSELLPGGYPGTPQHEQTVDDNAVNNELGYYVDKIKESLPSFPVKFNTDNNVNTGNGTEDKESKNIENNAENKDSGTYVEKFKESFPSIFNADNKDNTGNGAENKESRSMEDNEESKGSGTYVEKIKESLPSIPLKSNADNTGNGAENKESRNIENNAENKDSGTYVEKFKESFPSIFNADNKDNTGNGAENKESRSIEDNEKNKGSENYLEKIKESLPSIPLVGSGTENKESRNIENNAENKDNAEKSEDDKIRESFPLRFEPNSELKPSDDNDLTRATNKGSSALGSVGINPAAILGIGSESPRHPFYRDNPPEAEPFDLTGDYNKQKEQEQTAEHKAKLAQKQDRLDHKQKSEDKKHEKPERIDLGIKPLGSQQPPLPYKPEEAVGGTDPEEHGSKATKKDKVNATVGRAVGTLKQKIGKLVKNDSLVAKGTEQKAEIAELQKAKEF